MDRLNLLRGGRRSQWFHSSCDLVVKFATKLSQKRRGRHWLKIIGEEHSLNEICPSLSEMLLEHSPIVAKSTVEDWMPVEAGAD